MSLLSEMILVANSTIIQQLNTDIIDICRRGYMYEIDKYLMAMQMIVTPYFYGKSILDSI